MTLADAMGAAGLVVWAEIALVVFFVAFLVLVGFLVITRKSTRWERVRRLPLEDDTGVDRDRSTPPGFSPGRTEGGASK